MTSLHTFVLGDFQTNCYVVAPGGDACWIVDCGYDPDPMLDWIAARGLAPRGMLLTHCHSDHIAGIDRAIGRFGAMPITVHVAEAGWCTDPMLNLSSFLGVDVSVTEPDLHVRGGETLDLGGTAWRVIHTPGHSPGGVTYVNDAESIAIVGDTLFAGGIGRFDFPTSDVADLRRSVRETLMELPDEIMIHPGHGPSSTIGRERATNPYVIKGF